MVGGERVARERGGGDREATRSAMQHQPLHGAVSCSLSCEEGSLRWLLHNQPSRLRTPSWLSEGLCQCVSQHNPAAGIMASYAIQTRVASGAVSRHIGLSRASPSLHCLSACSGEASSPDVEHVVAADKHLAELPVALAVLNLLGACQLLSAALQATFSRTCGPQRLYAAQPRRRAAHPSCSSSWERPPPQAPPTAHSPAG